MAARKRQKTPSEVIRGIIQAAMTAESVTGEQLADDMGIHVNTVYSDLKTPEKIPQGRLWLYFVVLGIPVQEALESIAGAFAASLARR